MSLNKIELTFGLNSTFLQLDCHAMYPMVHGLGSILCVLEFPQVCKIKIVTYSNHTTFLLECKSTSGIKRG